MKNTIITALVVFLPIILLNGLAASTPNDSPQVLPKMSVPRAGNEIPSSGIITLHPLSIHDAIRLATEIRVYQRDHDDKWENVPVATLSEKIHPHMFHIMKTTSCLRGPGLGNFSDCRAVFLVNDKAISQIAYYSNIGLLTQPQGQRGIVSKELRRWLYGLTNKYHAPKIAD